MSNNSSATKIASVSRSETARRFLPYNSPLVFKQITLDDLPEINRIVRMSRSLTCDYTIGGIFMWVDYFKYQYCIYRDTLFISGLSENHPDMMAFSCPVGSLPLPTAINLLKDYCEERDMPLRFSAIPADCLACFTAINPAAEVEELTDWSDYVYTADSFATLSGKKMAKKRNHVNHFLQEYPEATLSPIRPDDIPLLKAELMRWHAEASEEPADSSTEQEELREVIDVLDHYSDYPFVGYMLRTAPDGPVAGFSMAEIINEMAFVHIEKMDHTLNGAGETLAHLFVKELRKEYPAVSYLNREEDCGDPGLRRAKESWHPAMLLRKYNVAL